MTAATSQAPDPTQWQKTLHALANGKARSLSSPDSTGQLPELIREASRGGLRLFPVKAGQKAPPLLSDWPTKATCDLAQLETWARLYPDCNWGLACGPESNVYAFDIDGSVGEASVAAWEEQFGWELPATRTHNTPNGRHLLFGWPKGFSFTISAGKLGAGLDARGDRGYILYPPSKHPSGHRYVCEDPAVPIADMPQWLIALHGEKLPVPAKPQAEVVTIGQGLRTPVLVSLAGKLHSLGVSADGIKGALRGLNESFTPPHEDSKIDRIVDDIMRRYPAGTVKEEQKPDLVCLASIAPRSVDWLWTLYLAKGMLAMLSGDPGAGKTYIALAIAAGFTRGRTPNGEACDPIDVIYMSVENAPAEVIRPRFDSLGGDAYRLHLFKGTIQKTEEGEALQGPISLSNISVIESALEMTRARLVIVDPIQSYLGATVDLHRSNETRPVLDGLLKLAEKYHCAFLLLRHLSKQNGVKAIHRGLGSIDLTGAVRSEMLAGSLPDDPEARALIHIKTNLGAYGHSLGYSIDSEGHFAWTGKSEITAGQMLEAPSNAEDRSAVDDAREWLADFLSEGSKAQLECRKHAESAGISFATLRRAKDALRVRSSKAAVRGAWLWALPDDGSKDGKVEI